MKKTLTAWSSGYDSTLVLYRLLKNTKDEVTAFRMDMSKATFTDPRVTFERIAAAEEIAVPKIAEWLTKNVRPFEFRTIKIDALDPQGWISLTMLNTALEIVESESFERFVYSRSEENNLSKNRLNWLRDIWDAESPRTTLETPLIDSKQGRPHAMATLPKELQAFMFSCDNPMPEPCGKCIKCKVTHLTREMMAQGVSADIIFDYYLRKMAVGPYLGALTVDSDFQPTKREWIKYPEVSK